MISSSRLYVQHHGKDDFYQAIEDSLDELNVYPQTQCSQVSLLMTCLRDTLASMNKYDAIIHSVSQTFDQIEDYVTEQNVPDVSAFIYSKM